MRRHGRIIMGLPNTPFSLPLELSPVALLVAFVLTLVAVLPGAQSLARAHTLDTSERASGMIGICLALLIQAFLATEAGWVLRPFRNGQVSAFVLNLSASVTFLFVAFVFWRRRRSGMIDVVAKVTDSSTHISQRGLAGSFVSTMASSAGDIPQITIAALVCAAFTPLSTLIGSVIALWAASITAAWSQRAFISLDVATKIAFAVFSVIGVLTLAVTLLTALSPNLLGP